jgi:hypothetical protein
VKVGLAGLHVVLGPLMSVPHSQLPSGALCLHWYAWHVQLRFSPGHWRSPQQIPFPTVDGLHATPFGPRPGVVELVVQ